MVTCVRKNLHELNLAGRKQEEAALRRYEATEWWPLGIAGQPSEKEFISCLRNGLVLCNEIDKIQSGLVQKFMVLSGTSKLSLFGDVHLFQRAFLDIGGVHDGMAMVNKYVLSNYDFIVYMLSTLGVISTEALTWKLIKVWLPVNVIFVGMLITSMFSLGAII